MGQGAVIRACKHAPLRWLAASNIATVQQQLKQQQSSSRAAADHLAHDHNGISKFSKYNMDALWWTAPAFRCTRFGSNGPTPVATWLLAQSTGMDT